MDGSPGDGLCGLPDLCGELGALGMDNRLNYEIRRSIAEFDVTVAWFRRILEKASPTAINRVAENFSGEIRKIAASDVTASEAAEEKEAP